MKCPACGRFAVIYKCDKCGDVRCSSTGCPGTMGGPKFSAGGEKQNCKACKKGKYKKIS